MPAFLIIEATITDLPRFRAYAEAVPALIARFGGRYRALRGEGL